MLPSTQPNQYQIPEPLNAILKGRGDQFGPRGQYDCLNGPMAAFCLSQMVYKSVASEIQSDINNNRVRNLELMIQGIRAKLLKQLLANYEVSSLKAKDEASNSTAMYMQVRRDILDPTLVKQFEEYVRNRFETRMRSVRRRPIEPKEVIDPHSETMPMMARWMLRNCRFAAHP